MKKRIFDVYDDIGHGWLKVKKDTLKLLGIADNITPFSYMKGDYAFLEEDCDAITFCGAYEDKFGIRPKFRYHHSIKLSRIRNYPHYSFYSKNN